MATKYISFGAFVESPKREFTESPHYERTDSSFGFTYSAYGRTFNAFIPRYFADLPLAIFYGPHGRTKFDNVFLTKTLVQTTDANNPSGGEQSASSWFTVNKFDGTWDDSGESGGISGVAPGTELISQVMTQNDADGIVTVDTYYSAAYDSYYIETITWSNPYTYAEWITYLVDIYDTKLADWVADIEADMIGTASAVGWTYDGTGAIVSGTPPGGAAGYWVGSDGDGLYITLIATAQAVMFTSTPDLDYTYFVRPVLYNAGDDVTSTPTGEVQAIATAGVNVPMFFYPAFALDDAPPLHILVNSPFILDILFDPGSHYGLVSLPP